MVIYLGFLVFGLVIGFYCSWRLRLAVVPYSLNMTRAPVPLPACIDAPAKSQAVQVGATYPNASLEQGLLRLQGCLQAGLPSLEANIKPTAMQAM